MEWQRALQNAAMSLLAIAVVFTGAGPAWAHEGEESDKAADLIRQAIALVVNEPGKLADAREKVGDARKAKDQTGVDMALLGQGDDALAAGDIHQGRAFLEAAIGARPHTGGAEPAPIRQTTDEPATASTEEAAPPAGAPMPMAGAQGTDAPMPMATGAEPGTNVVTEPLDVRRHLDGGDWALLFGSLAVGLFGVYLGLRFRPPHRWRTA